QPGTTPPAQTTPPPGESAPTARPPSESPQPGPSETSAPNGTTENAPANSVLGRWILQAANRFKDLDPKIRNSPMLQDMMRDLSHAIEGSEERWKALDKGANAIADKWERLGQTLPLDRLWPEKGFSWPRSLTGESLPKWHFPTGGAPSRRVGPRSLGQPGIPDVSG